MSPRERQAIIDAARDHAAASAKAQGLPDQITDPDVLRKIAALMDTPARKAA